MFLKKSLTLKKYTQIFLQQQTMYQWYICLDLKTFEYVEISGSGWKVYQDKKGCNIL